MRKHPLLTTCRWGDDIVSRCAKRTAAVRAIRAHTVVSAVQWCEDASVAAAMSCAATRRGVRKRCAAWRRTARLLLIT